MPKEGKCANIMTTFNPSAFPPSQLTVGEERYVVGPPPSPAPAPNLPPTTPVCPGSRSSGC